ncbi:MAG: methyltransferase domain-containing protein [Candidatus Lindowbacteria bacterium]|nr:methyltransferase domain-containing protein [Candidatus Lindowbacteria bacterium]
MTTLLLILLGIIGGFLFFVLVALKVVVRISAKMGKSAPCPPGLNWILDNPYRRRYAPLILERAGIIPGERVLELGTGPGLFTVRAARLLGPKGQLVSVDIQPKMIAVVEKNVREAGLTNVKTHVASAYELPLNDESMDRAFLITVLAEIPDRNRVLKELRRVIRPNGILSITEEFPDPDYPFAFETIRQVEPNGFKLHSRFGNVWNYTLNFRKA